MRIIGCVLMLSGWLLLLAALLLLDGLGKRFAFAGASLAVQALGLVVLAYAYRAVQRVADGPR